MFSVPALWPKKFVHETPVVWYFGLGTKLLWAEQAKLCLVGHIQTVVTKPNNLVSKILIKIDM